jgi:hypothetical protein
MATSLGRAVRDVNFKTTAALHVGGLLAGAMLTGSVLVLLTGLITPRDRQELCEAGLAFACGAVVLQMFGRRPPQSSWQVPEIWRRSVDPMILPVAYGFLLGLGILTAVAVASFWVFVVATPIQPPLVAVAGWSVYALARGATFVIGSSACELVSGSPSRLSTRGIVSWASSFTALGLTVLSFSSNQVWR